MKRLSIKKLLGLMVIVLVLTFGSVFVLNASAEKTEDSAGTLITVSIDGKERVFNLDVVDDDEDGAFLGAQSYVDSYADVLNVDPDFEKNIDMALETVRGDVKSYATFWSLVPPIIAILLALITKEVYSSLFVGILAGGLIYSGLNLETTMTHVFSDGFVASIADI